jgi:uncharacterized membrane protein YdjX (TVP38/TMEM64 family)
VKRVWRFARERWWRWLLVAGVIVLWRSFGPDLHLLQRIAHGAVLGRDAGLWGALGGMAAIYLGMVLLIPIPPLMMLAGWVWGFWGALVVLPAALGAAVTVFLLARALGQGAAANSLREHPKVAHYIDLGERGGFLTVALIRISPFLPFTPSNAALGLTRMPLRELIIGTPLGLLPASLLYLWAGRLLPDPGAVERGELLAPFANNRAAWAVVAAGVLLIALFAALLLRRLRSGHAGAAPPEATARRS